VLGAALALKVAVTVTAPSWLAHACSLAQTLEGLIREREMDHSTEVNPVNCSLNETGSARV
jgi:hypothetical protein